MGLSRFFRHAGIATVSLSLITACGGSNDSSVDDGEEIKALNIFAVEEATGNTINYFNESNARTRELASHFEAGDELILNLNTDEEKQGYEYLAYLDMKEVMLMNYETGRSTSVASFDGKICDLMPYQTISQNSFELNTPNDRQIKDRHAFFVRTVASDDIDCEVQNMNAYKVLIDDEDALDIDIEQQFHAIEESSVVVDYQFSETVNGETTQGRAATIDIRHDSRLISMVNAEHETVWELYLPDIFTGANALDDNDAIQVQQVTQTKVLFQIADKLFLVNVSELFDGQTFEGGSTIPADSMLVSVLTGEPAHTLGMGPSTKIDISKWNNASFSFVDANSTSGIEEVYFYHENAASDRFNKIYDLDATALSTTTEQISDAHLFIQNEYADTSYLSLVTVDTSRSALTGTDPIADTETILQSGEIMFFGAKDGVYINTMTPSNELRARFFELRAINSTAYKTAFQNNFFADSTFIKLNDVRTQNPTAVLLSQDLVNAEMVYSLYAFDKDENNGREVARDTDNERTEVSLGSIELVFDQIIRDSGTIINDKFGLIEINNETDTANETSDLYYFSPRKYENTPHETSLFELASIPVSP